MNKNKCSIFINEIEVNYRTDADNGYDAFFVVFQDLIKEVVLKGHGEKPSESILRLAQNGRYDIILALATKGVNAIFDELNNMVIENYKEGCIND